MRVVELLDLRERIEGIDNMLLACLNERARACRALQLARPREHGSVARRRARLQARAYELEMDRALRNGNEGPLTDTAIVWLFDTIRDATE